MEKYFPRRGSPPAGCRLPCPGSDARRAFVFPSRNQVSRGTCTRSIDKCDILSHLHIQRVAEWFDPLERKLVMAKVNAPLLSFGASGQIGRSIVFSVWKGISTARQFVVPSNPNTTDQQAQRGLMTDIVNAWRRPALTAALRTAWDLLASSKALAMSGFNLFTSNLVMLAAEDPDASYASAVASTVQDSVQISMINIVDGLIGDETGNFQIIYGSDPANMVASASAAIVTGSLSFNATSGGFETGDTIYVSIRKAGTGETIYDRAGIIEIVLS